jgi:hypothetical protein
MGKVGAVTGKLVYSSTSWEGIQSRLTSMPIPRDPSLHANHKIIQFCRARPARSLPNRIGLCANWVLGIVVLDPRSLPWAERGRREVPEGTHRSWL